MVYSLSIALICCFLCIFIAKKKSYHYIFLMYILSLCAIILTSFMYISKSAVFQFMFQFDYYIYMQLAKLKLPISTLSRLYNMSVALFMISSFLMTSRIRRQSSLASFFSVLGIVAFVQLNDVTVSRYVHIMKNSAPNPIKQTLWRDLSLVINMYTEILFLIFTVLPIIILIVKAIRSKIYINRRYSIMLLSIVSVIHGLAFLILRKSYSGIWLSHTDMSKIPAGNTVSTGFLVIPITLLLILAIVAMITSKTTPNGPFKLVSNSQWIEQNLSLSDGIGMAFHTHKNSLIALRQHLELIQIYMKKEDEEKIKEHFDISYNVISDQLESIKKTLNHLRSNKAPARQVDLSECIRASVKKLSYDGYLELNLLDGCIVMGDHDDICEAFLNVLFNAEYALTGRDDPQIKVKMLKEDDYIEVDIWDNGCGITKENLKHVFTPFFSTKPALQYGGLGLSSVRSTVNAHRGDVKIKSQENQFTVIKMVFPAYIKNL